MTDEDYQTLGSYQVAASGEGEFSKSVAIISVKAFWKGVGIQTF